MIFIIYNPQRPKTAAGDEKKSTDIKCFTFQSLILLVQWNNFGKIQFLIFSVVLVMFYLDTVMVMEKLSSSVNTDSPVKLI